MTDAYILEAVRTPRGRGRPDGSLHSITPIQLAAQALHPHGQEGVAAFVGKRKPNFT